MRKLLSWMSALIITSTSATSLVACGEDTTAYTQFMDHMNKNESFVYFIGAKDCPYCQTTNQTGWKFVQDQATWNSFTKGTDYGQAYHASVIYDGVTDQSKKKAYEDAYNNMHFYHYEVDHKADVFNDAGLKKIVNFMIKQIAEASKINEEEFKGWTQSDIGISSIPLFLFVDHGKYAGYETGSADTARPIMDWLKIHMNPGYALPYPNPVPPKS